MSRPKIIKPHKKDFRGRTLIYGRAYDHTWIGTGQWVVREDRIDGPRDPRPDQLRALFGARGVDERPEGDMRQTIFGTGPLVAVERGNVLTDTGMLIRCYVSSDASIGCWLQEDLVKMLHLPDELWLMDFAVRDFEAPEETTVVLASADPSSNFSKPDTRWCADLWYAADDSE